MNELMRQPRHLDGVAPQNVTTASHNAATTCHFTALRLLFTVALLTLFVLPAHAETATQSRVYAIPAGSLTAVLNRFAEESGFLLTAPGELTEGQTSTGLNGLFTVEQGLQSILAGSGLQYRFDDAGVVSLVAVTKQTGPIELAPIMVTGEFTTRGLSETATSVSVITTEELERKDSERIYDAVRGLPNITPTPPDFLPSIRGVASGGPFGLGGSFFGASEPRTSLIVDDVARPQTYTNNSFQSIFDVQQVEVLRGPQTTLRGNNTISGAYVVKTNDPVYHSEAKVQVGVNWDEISDTGYRLAAMGNTELIKDTLAARVVVEYLDDRVPVEVYDDGSVIPEGTDLQALSEYDNFHVRTKLLFEPSSIPNFSSLFTIEYENGRDIGFDSFIWGKDSTIFAPDGIETDPEDRLYGFSGGQPVFDTRNYTAIADLRYNLGETAELRSITSYSDTEFEETFQFSPVFGFDNMLRDRFAQEFIYTAELGNSLDVVSGVNYTREDAENTVGTMIGSEEARRSMAVFADLTYHLKDDLRLIGGGRLLRSEVDFEGTVFLPVDFEQRDTVLLPKVGVAYDLNPHQTLSATARRGFNPGGSSIDFNAFEIFEYGPEYVWTYELGYRGSFINSNVSVSGTVFYNDYKDYQFRFSPDPTTFRVFNFDGNSYGLELEVRAKVSDTITVGSGLGLLKTEIDAAGETVDGNEFGEDPPVTLSGNIVWQATPELSFDVAANYVAEYYSNFNNEKGSEAGDYINVDLGATYDTRLFTLRAYVRNVTDHFSYHLRNTNNPDGSGYVLPPREIGLTLTVPM